VRNKESNRISDLADGLRMMGIEVDESEDGLVIHGNPHPRSVGVLKTKDDHRLAMAFALFSAGDTDVELDDVSVVAKSWPSYFADMRGVLGQVQGSH
jgi:3-phosphoshikimate 1-carboxyvinyltransferase